MTWKVQTCLKWMYSSGMNEGELREQPANQDSPGKMAVKIVCTELKKTLYFCPQLPRTLTNFQNSFATGFSKGMVY